MNRIWERVWWWWMGRKHAKVGRELDAMEARMSPEERERHDAAVRERMGDSAYESMKRSVEEQSGAKK